MMGKEKTQQKKAKRTVTRELLEIELAPSSERERERGAFVKQRSRASLLAKQMTLQPEERDCQF